MRIVDQHRERLAFVDGLKPSRDLARGGDRLDARAGVDAQRPRRREGADHVVDVEAAAQRRVQQQRAVGRLHGEARAVEPGVEVDASVVAVGVERERGHVLQL
jgi:hypothetical protein